jgi:hypothetical protein
VATAEAIRHRTRQLVGVAVAVGIARTPTLAGTWEADREMIVRCELEWSRRMDRPRSGTAWKAGRDRPPRQRLPRQTQF